MITTFVALTVALYLLVYSVERYQLKSTLRNKNTRFRIFTLITTTTTTTTTTAYNRGNIL